MDYYPLRFHLSYVFILFFDNKNNSIFFSYKDLHKRNKKLQQKENATIKLNEQNMEYNIYIL